MMMMKAAAAAASVGSAVNEDQLSAKYCGYTSFLLYKEKTKHTEFQ